ncbi:hypothetical protein EI015_26235 [Escherichia coli]|nr:hypothetical protein [Escherichia coli]
MGTLLHGVLQVVVLDLVVAIQDMEHLVAAKMHMMVVWILVGICNLKALLVDSHLMVLLDIVLLLGMGMVWLIMG